MHTVKGIMIIKTKVNTYKTDITKKNKQLNKICDKLRNTKTNPQLKILSEKNARCPRKFTCQYIFCCIQQLHTFNPRLWHSGKEVIPMTRSARETGETVSRFLLSSKLSKLDTISWGSMTREYCDRCWKGYVQISNE